MKALAGMVCALFAAGCMATGPLVPQTPTALQQPFAAPIHAVNFTQVHPGGPESVPVVALPSELFAPATADATPPTHIRLAALTARPGVVETALIVPASPAPVDQGPMLIPTTVEMHEPFAEAGPPLMTASAESITVVEKPAATPVPPQDALAFQQPAPAASQPAPTFVQPGPTFAPAQPGMAVPGGPAMIAPGGPIIVPDQGLPPGGGGLVMPGGPCESCHTCPPWIGMGECSSHHDCCLFAGCDLIKRLFSGCGLFDGCGDHACGPVSPCGPACGPVCGGCDPCGTAGGYMPGTVYGGVGPAGMCDPCGIPCEGVAPRACHTVFGEFLFLTARGADVHFATPTDGAGINAVPRGNADMADPAYDPGFRVGGTKAISPRTSILLMYTDYESSVNDLSTRPGGNEFLRAVLVHPNTTAADTDHLAAEADYEIDFQFADIGLTHDLWRDCDSRVTSVAGFRYANIDQELAVQYSAPALVTTVLSDVEFDGIGPRLGIDTERHLRRRFSVYGNAFVNFIAGSIDGRYVQLSRNDPLPLAIAGVEDDRVVTILEAEVGLAYRPVCGWWRASLGFYGARWMNMMTTSDFIQAVQADDFNDVSDTLTFDGLTARLQFEF